MTVTKAISPHKLGELGLRAGDHLHVIGMENSMMLVEIWTSDETNPGQDAARDWIQSAKGSVSLRDGDLDEARMDYYREKYALDETA